MPLVFAFKAKFSLTWLRGKAWCGVAERSIVNRCAVRTCWTVGVGLVSMEAEDAVDVIGDSSCGIWFARL